MSNYIKNIHLTLVMFCVINLNTDGQILNSFNKIETTGIVNLFANNLSQTEPIKWIITTHYIDETDYSIQNSKDTTYLFGDSVRILLVKKLGKYTFYNIYALNNDFSDSASFQVLDKGIPEKYLYTYKSIPSKPIVVYVIIPDDIQNSDFIMVMHGTDRNSLDYSNAWKLYAKQNNCLIVAPTFSNVDWPKSNSYNLGNMFSSTNYIKINNDSLWTFTIVGKIHDELTDAFGMQKKTYDIWGHSAGAQFVHRMMTFKPDYKVRYAICANAGWYTIPSFETNYPFGLLNKSLNYDETFLEDLVIKNIIIMRGTADTLRDSNLNTSKEADEQGTNRYARAATYYGFAAKIALKNNWKLIDVEYVGHEYALMAKAAQEFLLNPTNISNQSQSNFNNYYLGQNYPNPFNPTTNIEFNIQNCEFVSLKVYDIIGSEVATLVNENKTSGIHNVTFDAANLASGIYFYKLQAGNFTAIKKLMLLK